MGLLADGNQKRGRVDLLRAESFGSVFGPKAQRKRPKLMAGALVVLAGLPEFLRPFSFPVPLGVTIGLLLPDLLVRRS